MRLRRAWVPGALITSQRRAAHVLALTPKGKSVRERAPERITDPPAELATLSPADQRALKLAFEDFYTQPADVAELYLAEWVEMTHTSGLERMIDFACSVAEHWDGVVRWFHSKISNSVLEAISSLVQAAKRRARGFLPE